MLVATVFIAALVLGPLFVMPWPASNNYLIILHSNAPEIYRALEWGYYLLWGSSFAIGYVVLVQVGERVRTRGLKQVVAVAGKAPVPVRPDQRQNLEVVLGTVYDPKRLGEPAEHPTLAIIPEYGLYTGLIVLASTGWGKTRYALTPIADQVLGFQCRDEEKKIGGLALEVKGTFCNTVHELLRGWGREEDYVELRPGGKVKYNPIDPKMSPSAVATTISTLMVNLYGEDRDKFWSQAGGEAIKNIVALFRRFRHGHCTLHDIMLAMTDGEFLADKIKEEMERDGTGAETLIVSLEEWAKRQDDITRQGFAIVQAEGELPELRAPFKQSLWEWLKAEQVPYVVEIDLAKKTDHQLASIKRWYWGTWLKLRADIRSAITAGLTPFLGLFDSEPELLETFCPAQDAEDQFAGWEDAIESGKVVACAFDTITDGNMSRLLGVLIKQAYERAVLRRIPKMRRNPGAHHRATMLLIDECHALLTAGETGFGDEQFLAMSREAKCIPLFATQSKTSLEASIRSKKGADVILGNLKTKIFGHLEDPDSAKYASEMCGQEDRWIPHVSIGESGQKSRVSVLGPGTIADQSSVTANKGYNEQLRAIFRPDLFLNKLHNGQAIVRFYDGKCSRTLVVYLAADAVPFEVNGWMTFP